jgi:NTP pyrophosphatase (non-canonical NTP hydrolase)
MDFTLATDQATRVRGLYHQLEEHHEGSRWEIKDDMLGFVNDVGTLSRLIMATEGRWKPEGEVAQQLPEKLSECIWWVLVLASRLDIDMDEAFGQTMDRIERHLEQAAGRMDG